MREIVVCGGGVAGAGLACALSTLDFSVTLLEKDTWEDVGDVKRGEVLRPEVCRVLTEFGFMPDLERENPVIRRAPRQELWHATVGKLGEFRYDILAEGYPVLYLPHQGIVAALHKRLRRQAHCHVIYEAEARRISEYREGKRKVSYAERGARREREVSADLVVVADGGSSHLRSGLGIGVDSYDYGLGYLMFTLERPKEMYWGRHCVGPAGYVGLFHMPGDLIRAAVEVPLADLKTWLSASIRELKEWLVRRSPLLTDCGLKGRGIFYHVIRRHAAQYVVDGVSFLGDAAHTTHPMTGQGMSMVFNDIHALFDLLKQHRQGPFTATVLVQYERAARPFNSSVMQNNHNLFTWLQRIGWHPDYYHEILPELRKLGFDPASPSLS